MNLLKKWWLWGLLVLLAIGGGLGYKFWAQKNAAPLYRTVKLEKGTLTASVAASGTLQPVVSVQVGSQVSGLLKEVLVDFNSLVKKGQLIARIDPETFEYKLRQAQADLDAARSQVLTQQATIAVQRASQSQVEVSLADARRDLERKLQLQAKHFISGADVDKAQATMNALAEQVKAAQAQVEVARANAGNVAAVVKQREASLAQARIDLERTGIRSPITGIVIKRSVDKGQTVAASLQAPELFIIAENLTDMRVDTAIDESEVGKIKIGQRASFTVDAFPGKVFDGTVQQVRKAAVNVSNVVTYLVEVSASNPDLLLLPGMTANVRVVTEVREGVLKVPNAALRFRPPKTEQDKNTSGNNAANTGNAGSRHQGARSGAAGKARLYRLEAGELVALPVKLGASDGLMTEVSAENLTEGTEVVIGTNDAGDKRRPSAMGGGPRMF